MQYCRLTMGNEVHAFPYRHRRVEAHRKAGDALREQFVRYEIVDEIQQVRFGKRGLPSFRDKLPACHGSDRWGAQRGADAALWASIFWTTFFTKPGMMMTEPRVTAPWFNPPIS